MPLQRRHWRAGLGVPQTDPGIGPCRGDPPTVGADGDIVNPPFVLASYDFFSRRPIQQAKSPGQAVQPAAHDRNADVRVERNREDIRFLVVLDEYFLARGHVPNDGAMARARTDPRAIGTESQGEDVACVSKCPLFLARGPVPEAHGIVPTTRPDLAAVRAEGHQADPALVPAQDELGVFGLTGEVPPLPAAKFVGGVVQRPSRHGDVVQLYGTGGGGDIGPVALP